MVADHQSRCPTLRRLRLKGTSFVLDRTLLGRQWRLNSSPSWLGSHLVWHSLIRSPVGLLHYTLREIRYERSSTQCGARQRSKYNLAHPAQGADQSLLDRCREIGGQPDSPRSVDTSCERALRPRAAGALFYCAGLVVGVQDNADGARRRNHLGLLGKYF